MVQMVLKSAVASAESEYDHLLSPDEAVWNEDVVNGLECPLFIIQGPPSSS
jgi:hypothetical protein